MHDAVADVAQRVRFGCKFLANERRPNRAIRA